MTTQSIKGQAAYLEPGIQVIIKYQVIDESTEYADCIICAQFPNGKEYLLRTSIKTTNPEVILGPYPDTRRALLSIDSAQDVLEEVKIPEEQPGEAEVIHKAYNLIAEDVKYLLRQECARKSCLKQTH